MYFAACFVRCSVFVRSRRRKAGLVCLARITAPAHLPCVLTLPSCPGLAVSCPANDPDPWRGGKEGREAVEARDRQKPETEAETEDRSSYTRASCKHRRCVSASVQLSRRTVTVVYCHTGSWLHLLLFSSTYSAFASAAHLHTYDTTALRHYGHYDTTQNPELHYLTISKEYSNGTTRGTYRLAARYSPRH